MKKCSRCGDARYCNRQCQKKDWPVHKKKCGRPALNETSSRDVAMGMGMGKPKSENQELPLFDAFELACFSSFERVNALCEMSPASGKTLKVPQLLLHIVYAWTGKNMGGVIIRNSASNRFIGIEFTGPWRKDGDVAINIMVWR